MGSLFIKCWNVDFLLYAFLKLFLKLSSVCVFAPESQPSPSLWPLLAYAAFSFVSISLFPLPLFSFCFLLFSTETCFALPPTDPLFFSPPNSHSCYSLRTFSLKPNPPQLPQIFQRIHCCYLFFPSCFTSYFPSLSDHLFYSHKYISACPPVCLSLCLPVPSVYVPWRCALLSIRQRSVFHQGGT